MTPAQPPTVQLVRNRKRWTPQQREQSQKFWEKKAKKEARKAKSAFFRERVFKPDQQKLKQELQIKVKGDFQLEALVTNLRLQGSTIAAKHQDLICRLSTGKFLRFSRNNSSDTAQHDASPDLYPKIQDYKPYKGTTVKDALDAFRGAHDEIPRYDHGDCQSFADEIVYRLTGKRTGFGGGGLDFM